MVARRIKLKVPYRRGDKEYQPGQVIIVEQKDAAIMVKLGLAEYCGKVVETMRIDPTERAVLLSGQLEGKAAAFHSSRPKKKSKGQ